VRAKMCQFPVIFELFLTALLNGKTVLSWGYFWRGGIFCGEFYLGILGDSGNFVVIFENLTLFERGPL
jgi:hypothetical protein